MSMNFVRRVSLSVNIISTFGFFNPLFSMIHRILIWDNHIQISAQCGKSRLIGVDAVHCKGEKCPFLICLRATF